MKSTMGLRFLAGAMACAPAWVMGGDSERRVLPVGERPESVTKGWGGHYYVTVMGAESGRGDAVVKVLIAEFFHGHVLEFRDGQLRRIATGLRGADGVERAKDGAIYASSWTQGKVWRLGADGRDPKVVIEGLKSAADFFLDEDARRLLVPDMLAGTVTIMSLN